MALLAAALAAPAAAQIDVDGATEVRAIRFSGAHALSERKLRAAISTKDRGGAYGLRVALGKLPFVPAPTPHPFSPLILQQDVVRLRQAYAVAGHFFADVRYKVVRDDERNLLDITFVIDEGRPLVVTEVTVRNADTTAALPVAERDQKSWARLERSLLRLRGRSLDVDDANDGRDRLQRWWRDRGYPLAEATLRPHSDSTRSQGSLSYRVATGTAARFGDIAIEGNRSLDDRTVRRLVPIERGDRYSVAALERSQVTLRQLDLVRVASVDVPALEADSTGAIRPLTAADSVLPVRVQITEGDRRIIGADLGYVTDGGLSAEGTWEHRDFTGGGRSLKVSLVAQTGWLAVAQNPDVRYRLAPALKQPAFLAPNLSGVLSPFLEYRDDTQDRSTQYGLNTTLVRQASPLRSISLNYQIADRIIHEYRFGDLANGEIDLLTFLTQAAQGALDSLGTTIATSALSLSASFGSLDNPANPRFGYLVRPVLQVTAPTAWSSTAYWRADGSAYAYLPLGRRVTLAGRATLGQLFPFGKSIPAPGEDPTVKFLQLRDVNFTAGGTGDVRGWENRLLGPKVPEVTFTVENGDTIQHVDGYVPLGGLERATFSVELQFPLPGLGPNFGSHVFIDGGRVATDDKRFDLQQAAHGQQAMFYATGAGIDMRTPVGPIKMGFGYKLNPSLTDLVDAADLSRAANEGKPVDDLPRDNSRRWQFYLAIGASY